MRWAWALLCTVPLTAAPVELSLKRAVQLAVSPEGNTRVQLSAEALKQAESVGVHGVVIPTHRAAVITPAVVSASAGACEHMLVAQANLTQAILQFKQENAWVVGLDEEGEPVGAGGDARLQGALVVVVGSEGEGLRPLVKSACDFLLRLPMQGQIQSLNASVAGSVALYLAYLARQKSV